MSVIAGGAGAGGLLLVVTTVILFCILIMRRVHSTTESKYTYLLLLFLNIDFNFCISFLSLSVSFSPKPDNQHSLSFWLCTYSFYKHTKFIHSYRVIASWLRSGGMEIVMLTDIVFAENGGSIPNLWVANKWSKYCNHIDMLLHQDLWSGCAGPEEVGHCMLSYIRDQILELVNETLLVPVL